MQMKPSRSRQRSACEDLADDYAKETAKDCSLGKDDNIKLDWHINRSPTATRNNNMTTGNDGIFFSPSRHQTPPAKRVTFGSPLIATYYDDGSTPPRSEASSLDDEDEVDGTPPASHPEFSTSEDVFAVSRKLDVIMELSNSEERISGKKVIGAMGRLVLVGIILVGFYCFVADHQVYKGHNNHSLLTSEKEATFVDALLPMPELSKVFPALVASTLPDQPFSTGTTAEQLQLPTVVGQASQVNSESSPVLVIDSVPTKSLTDSSDAPFFEVYPKRAAQQKGTKYRELEMMGTSVAISRDAEIMATGSVNRVSEELRGTVRSYSRSQKKQQGSDLSLGTIPLENAASMDAMLHISLSSNGICLVAGWAGQVRLFHEQTGNYTEDFVVNRLFRKHIKTEASISSVAISSDCRTIAVAADAIYIAARSSTNTWLVQFVHMFGVGGDIVRSFARASLSSNAERLAVGSISQRADGSVVSSLYVLNHTGPAGRWSHLGAPLATFYNQSWHSGDLVAISEDGTTVAVEQHMNSRGAILVYSYVMIDSVWQQLGEALMGDVASSFATALSLSSDGKCLAIRFRDGLFVAYAFNSTTALWNPMGEYFYSSSLVGDSQDRMDGEHWAYPKVALSGDCDWVAFGDPSARNSRGGAHMFQL